MNRTDSPIGLFRHDITDPKQLAATTVARDHLVNDLLNKLKNRGNKKSGQNHLFIGPRGIGKTHLLSLLEQGLNSDESLNKQYTLIRFPEESNRILSFADLLLGIIDRLADTEVGENKSTLRELHNKLETEEKDEEIIDYIVPRLKTWHKQTGKSLLIMLENLDVLFNQQIKSRKDIHRIRSLLMDNSHILLIGTAPTFFPALNDIKHPLYDFFDIQVLEELSKEQTLSLVKANLKWEKREDLLQKFEELKPRLLAMHILTGGNPRLIMMLYELIAKDNLNDIITRFHQLLDRITPFYQDRIKDLSPQERALLETIALMRTQQRTPVNIAKIFRKSRKQTSVLLKRMTEAGYLSVHQNPDDRRSRLYRIKEGFFDIWLAMNESRANRKHLPFLVDFLSLWFASKQERERKRQQLTMRLDELDKQGRNNALKVLDYLSETSLQLNEKQQAKLELALQQSKLGDKQAATNLLKEVKTLIPQQKEANEMMVWMQDKASQWCVSKQDTDEFTRMGNIIKFWQVKRSGDLETASKLFHELSLDFSSHGLHKLHIALLQEQQYEARQDNDKTKEAALLNNISLIYHRSGDYETALDFLNQSLAISQAIDDKASIGTTLNNISTIYKARGDYQTALDFLNQSLAISQAIGDKAGEGAMLNNISHIYDARGDYQTALDFLNQSLAISQAIDDKASIGTTLNNISTIYKARGDYQTALDFLNQSLDISQAIGDKAGEGATMNNISQIYTARGDYVTALDFLNQSLAISQAIGDKAVEGATMNNISQIYKARGDYQTALDYLNQSLATQQEIGNKEGEGAALNNISAIYNARGDYQTALNYLNQSLAIQQEIGDKAGKGAALNNISQIYTARGDYETAMNYLNQSLAIQQEIGDKAGESTALNNISQIYTARGDYETAMNYLNQSLAILQEIGDKAGEGTALNNISTIYLEHSDHETALDYLNQSLAIQQEISDKAREGATLNNISQIYTARGDYETAMNYLNQSLAIQQEIGDIAGLCATKYNIGNIHWDNNKQGEAMKEWLNVYIIAKEIDLAQALDALESLADSIGLKGGLDGWKELASKEN